MILQWWQRHGNLSNQKGVAVADERRVRLPDAGAGSRAVPGLGWQGGGTHRRCRARATGNHWCGLRRSTVLITSLQAHTEQQNTTTQCIPWVCACTVWWQRSAARTPSCCPAVLLAQHPPAVSSCPFLFLLILLILLILLAAHLKSLISWVYRSSTNCAK